MDRKRLKNVALLGLALLVIFTPIVLNAEQQEDRADDQAAVADWLARRDAAQAELIETQADLTERNEELIGQLAEVSAQREADRQAFELKACRYGNDAKRTAREDTAAAFDVSIATLMEYLRLSPHSDGGLIDEAEATARSRLAAVLSTPEVKDHDCNGDGVIGDAGDYP